METKNLLKAAACTMIVAFAISACQTKKTANSENADPAHNSMNSVDWAGTYQGTLPCADCPGIRYTLTLKDDETYVLKTRYLEKGDSVFTESGAFAWDENGGKITLADRGEKFHVGENKLFHLDMEGNRITGSLAEHYILTKMTNQITDRYWKLIEVNGQAVADGSTQKEPYIQLNSEKNRLQATGGCNGLGGTYELKEPNRISFSQLMGTMMACENMEVENGLKRALESADSYHVQGDTLQLFRARMAPLAKFVAIEK
ncbi:copper resistance protein NlpE N-terminal domain-containing protein [Parapedobacter sp. 10938]|uniref:copper resistance protein NlpE N-terminal domain-containing protein n=1 Tax=Parapedobacter flavus TaxID=3110225 RepID=UPI002DB5F533|nr:copper resistance protein NlpE N-terminal domain-containing protein [Parapedobacter sp. 10938]MEC3880941.1 copper resistance protein NlpE N-terminal domain-containing protein [Parapedobacter sp. 10938]